VRVAAPYGGDATLVLSPSAGRVGKLAAMLVFTLFWNGIVGVFVYVIFFAGARIETCGAIFMIPCAAIGLLLFALLLREVLALANPRPTLRIPRAYLRPGDSFELTWQFSGQVHRISHLRIYLEAREAATYTRGTKTTTDHRVFLTQPIADTSSLTEMVTGRAQVRLPAQAVPSFRSAHNAIEWRLIVHGVIANWPDVKDEFPLKLEVLTPEGVQRATAN
jgi:hypothetical protein